MWLCRCHGDEERCREAIECFIDTKVDLIEARVALLTELVPPPRTVHTFFNPESSLAVDELSRLERACSTLGMEVSAHVTRTRDEVKEVLASLKPRHDHAIFRLSDSM